MNDLIVTLSRGGVIFDALRFKDFAEFLHFARRKWETDSLPIDTWQDAVKAADSDLIRLVRYSLEEATAVCVEAAERENELMDVAVHIVSLIDNPIDNHEARFCTCLDCGRKFQFGDEGDNEKYCLRCEHLSFVKSFIDRGDYDDIDFERN